MQVWRAVSRQVIFALAVILVSTTAFSPVIAADESNDLSRAVQLYQEITQLTGQGKFQDAIPLAREALSIQEKVLGSDHPSVAQGLNVLALLYFKLGRYAEAGPLYQRSLDILEKARGPNDPAVATGLDSLAQVYVNQGRYTEGEALEKRELAIREKAFGPDNPDVAHTLNNIAEIYRAQGRATEAEPLYQRSLEIFEKVLGQDDLEVAASLNNLANLYVFEGRYAESEILFKRSLTIREKALGPEHPDIGTSVASLAQLYIYQGRYAEAEPLLKRGLSISEKAFGPDHPNVAANLNYLAVLYVDQGRNDDAQPLFVRSTAIYEKSLGPDSTYVATVLNNLALSYVNQSMYAKAEPLYQRSLKIIEKALGPESIYVAIGLNNLAGLYVDERKYAAAEPLYQRSLQIDEKALGPDHPDVAINLNNLADLYSREARYSEAEPLYQRSLGINEKALGPSHPNVATSLNNLALLNRNQHRDVEALDYSRRAVSILSRRFSERGSDRDGGRNTERNSQRSFFTTNVSLVVAVGGEGATAESFRNAQFASASAAAQAVAGMAARFAAGSDALGAVVRERQDLQSRWQLLDKAIVAATGKPPDKRDPATEAAVRKELAETEAKLTQVDAQIAREFPQYAELSNPKPVELADTQALLGPQEAMLVYLFGDDGGWLWVVRRDRAAVFKLDLSAGALSDEVAKLRQRLDPATNGDLTPFDTKRAHALYDKIWAPAATLLEGVHEVLVVPDGALASLPLGVLVTKPPASDPDKPGDYRDIAWLAKDYALSVLPSVGSLKSLRLFAQGGRGDRPFIGFGAPTLDGKPGSERGVKLAGLFRGGTADVDAVRKLPPLPETADELRAVANDLGADERDLYLGDRATEPLLRQAQLNQYRVIEFATHGLMSGELQGLAEPALVLTPPKEASPSNDGLLTASKIATLKLDADWVVLSACNTAASDGTPDAGGLSGLAKAFFYAGARSLLLSNWEIPSKATVKLVTGVFDELKRDPTIGRAEALRRAEMAMLDPMSPPEYAEPMFWASFVVAGEGSRGDGR
jgi:CHAT domain-containing protein/tetratricopeptide (TPR) repeat protein